MRTKILAAAALAVVTALGGAAAARSASGHPRTSALTGSRPGTIAFLRFAPDERGLPGQGGQVFVMKADGGELRPVTGQDVYAYAWSPDGRRIAYIDQGFSLWLVRPDGTGRQLLLRGSKLSSLSLSWSRNGKRIAIAAGPSPDPTHFCKAVYVVSVAGGRPVRLDSSGCDVAWSPRGDEIAYDDHGGGGIWAIHPNGTGLRKISSRGSGPRWSSDGSRLAIPYLLRWVAPGRSNVHDSFGVVRADGTGFHIVTTHAYNEYGVAWSPHGRRILYGGENRTGIYVISPDGRKKHRVTTDSPPQTEFGALAWAPSGKAIVYAADRTGDDQSDLYVIGTDGRRRVQLTDTPAWDVDPSWVVPR